jgi:hypothetical protein
MIRRVAIAAIYTLILFTLLLTWARWTTPPVMDHATVITDTKSARWLLIFTPFLWGWVAFYSPGKWRKIGLVGSTLFLLACFAFIYYRDCLWYPGCLWYTGCSGWVD